MTWARLTLSYRIDARLIFPLLRQYGSSPVVAVGYRSHCILIGMLTLGSYPEWHRTAGFFLSLSAIDLLKRVCDNLPADQHGFNKYRIFHAINYLSSKLLFFVFLIVFFFGLIVFVVGFVLCYYFLFGRVINIYLLLNPIFGFLITIRDFYSKSYLFGFVW